MQSPKDLRSRLEDQADSRAKQQERLRRIALSPKPVPQKKDAEQVESAMQSRFAKGANSRALDSDDFATGTQFLTAFPLRRGGNALRKDPALDDEAREHAAPSIARQEAVPTSHMARRAGQRGSAARVGFHI